MDKKNLLFLLGGIVLISGIVFYMLVINNSEVPFENSKDEISSQNKELTPSEKCVITVRGEKYDVTEFRNKHKGGNIFKCGEDMTDAFNKQHGDNQFRDLQKYKVN